jgi:ribosomal protein S18 acetylase RimI-like enzyme
MNNIHIKRISVIDVEDLQIISKQTFFETFANENSESDMKNYLNENLSLDTLKKELFNTKSEFYVLSFNEKIIGYLKLNFGEAQTELKNNTSLEIERIYVLKEFHGQNMGQLLYNNALEIATKHSIKEIWLGVWEKNKRAISFYKKNGFIEFDTHIFKLGNDEQIDIMMKLKLN